MEIGKKKNLEHFNDNYENDNSLNFLLNNNNTNTNASEEFKKKIMKYIQQDVPIEKETEFDKKNLFPVAPANTFLSDNNVPNFESNVADIKKFYKINYDNLNENELKSTSIETLKNVDSIQKVTSINTNSINNEPVQNPYVRNSKEVPDNWNYKNELPMNGGKMNGIVGFDSLESQFASFNGNKLNLQTVSNDDNKYYNIPHDDLRKPIIYEN
jgi:hypothetical protein